MNRAMVPGLGAMPSGAAPGSIRDPTGSAWVGMPPRASGAPHMSTPADAINRETGRLAAGEGMAHEAAVAPFWLEAP